MLNEKKTTTSDEKNTQQEINIEELEKVTGGTFEDVPRVPVNPIDDSVKQKI